MGFFSELLWQILAVVTGMILAYSIIYLIGYVINRGVKDLNRTYPLDSKTATQLNKLEHNPELKRLAGRYSGATYLISMLVALGIWSYVQFVLINPDQGVLFGFIQLFIFIILLITLIFFTYFIFNILIGYLFQLITKYDRSVMSLYFPRIPKKILLSSAVNDQGEKVLLAVSFLSSVILIFLAYLTR